MNTLRQKVKSVLAKHFEPDKLRIEKHDERRIRGFIVSSRFAGLDDLDRQTMIEKILKKTLSEAEQARILLFQAYTPGEYEAYNEPISTSA